MIIFKQFSEKKKMIVEYLKRNMAEMQMKTRYRAYAG